MYRLKRKYGDTVEDVIAFGQKAREELERIQSFPGSGMILCRQKSCVLYAMARKRQKH